MWLLSALITFNPIYSYSVPVDSVKIHFTFDKKEPVNSDQTSYYYHVSIENISHQDVYVIFPKWINSQPAISGIMNSVYVESHDDLEEYALLAQTPFEIYKVPANSSFTESNCKIKAKNVGVDKLSKIDIPIYIADEVKIGEIRLNEYVDHKDFYGGNIPYKIVGASTTHETLALK